VSVGRTASQRRTAWWRAARTYANLVPFIFFALFPFYFMFVTSFKRNAELYNLKAVPFWIQTGAIGDHYTFLFQKTEFLIWMKNSLTISVIAMTVSLMIAILAGYSLARLRFRGVSSFGTAVFITYLVPPTLLFLPLSQVINWLGLSDSIWALVVTYPTFLVPFSTWLLMGYFRTVPREVEECALVDGASRMQTLTRIVLPMAVPGVVCAALFGFTLCWNEYIYALTFVSQSANKTAVVGVTADLIRGDIYYWGSLMAGAVLASVPIVVIYVWFLDYYVSGLTAGAVKG
jgi:multiple sugar transport system permease protein